MNILPLTADHWPAVSTIYAEGVATGTATFTTGIPTRKAWDAGHLPTCRPVAADGATSAGPGWATLSPVSSRCVYAGVASVSMYVGAKARGRGVGRALLAALAMESEQNGLWTSQAGVFPENGASGRLHAAAGFRLVSWRERIGQRRGVWHASLLLERRSAVVGTEPEPSAPAAPCR